MKRTHILSLLLAFVLALTAPTARAADGTPTMELTGETDDSVVLELTGLDGSYCGIQATITLSNMNDASFEPDDVLYTSRPSLYYTYIQDGAELTIYIVAKSSLNDGSGLRLGTVSSDRAFSVVSMSNLKLLTVNDLEGTVFGGGNFPQRPPSNNGTPDDPFFPFPNQPGTPAPVSYRVNIPASLRNGSVRLSTQQAVAGDEVTLTVLPDEGYELDQLTVTAADGSSLPLTPLSGGRYQFTMPKSSVTVQVTFAAVKADAPAEKPTTPEVPVVQMPFLDVAASSWYYEAVAYVYGSDLMRGVDAYAFAPDGFTTRAQIVTILHRLEGEPLSVSTGKFVDVAEGQWYTSAVNWAAENKIVDGYGDERFGPNDNITREQMAAILYRYTEFKGESTGASGDLMGFADGSSVSTWAVEAMRWANGSKLITGKAGNVLDPGGNATRAEVATILMRYREAK